MTMQLTKMDDILDDGEFRVGNRYYIKDQGMFEIVSMPTAINAAVRLCKVNGKQQMNTGLPMLRHMLNLKQLLPASRGITLKELNKDVVGLSPQGFFNFEHKVKIVKALLSLATGSPKPVSNDEIRLITEMHNHGAAAKSLAPCKAPSYPAARRWVRIYERRYLFQDLAWADHRALPRKKRLISEADEMLHTTIKDFYAHWLQPSAEPVYCEYVRRCVEAHPEYTDTERRKFIGSKSTFYRRLAACDQITIREKRVGRSNARKQMKWGGPTQMPNYIGGLVEIDSTQVDVFVKHEDFRFTYRPHLTVFLDIATRCVLAWDFSLSPPSGFKSARTLQKCVTRDDYLYRAIPTRFVGDHGPEFVSETFIRQCIVLGADPEFANPDHPDGKPHIESKFASANASFFHQVAGSTKGLDAKKRMNKPEKEAVYTLETLEQRFIAYLDMYHHSVHSGLEGMTPHQMWVQLMQDPIRAPRTLAVEDAVLIGYEVERRAVRKGRVGIHGLEWHAPSSAKLEADLKKSGRQAEVRVNPFDLGRVFICDPGDRKNTQHIGYAVKEKYQNGLTLEDHRAIRKNKAEWKKIYNDDIALAIRKAEFYRILRNDAEDGVLDDLRAKQTRTAISTQRAAKALAAAKSVNAPRKSKKAPEPDLPSDVGDLSDYLG
jgi:putative transposase